MSSYPENFTTGIFCESMADLQKKIHENSIEKGFWQGFQQNNIPTKIALIHSEVSETLEAHRKGDPESEKCPGISLMAEEMADTVIRVMDLAERLKIDLAGAILAKVTYNKDRPYMHGGKAY